MYVCVITIHDKNVKNSLENLKKNGLPLSEI